MPHSTCSSGTSGPCRIEWRPSRWIWLALHGLGALAGISVWWSEMPRAVAAPLALLAAGYGVWLAGRERRRPVRQLVWPVQGPPMIDGMALAEAQLRWRGPLAFLRWRCAEGRVRRLAWWPDVLPAAARRELRLAALESSDAASAASVAP